MKKRIGSVLMAMAMAVAVGAGLLALMTATTPPAEAGRCICPHVYAPVVCSNGKTYPNQCVANCRHARDCEPAGIF